MCGPFLLLLYPFSRTFVKGATRVETKERQTTPEVSLSSRNVLRPSLTQLPPPSPLVVFARCGQIPVLSIASRARSNVKVRSLSGPLEQSAFERDFFRAKF